MHQRFERNVERARDLPQQQDGDVALSGLELREVAFRDSRIAGEDLARHAAAGARLAHSVSQQLEVIGFGAEIRAAQKMAG